ncbi:hypothetical protein [Nocardia cyriacigeorgica]|uniref:hypothetical protein n=1 Tax=Nocardia cyriacigeorgica TaxID=135487 RepID=UPI00189506DB|nr:hypothetical protein [Nocardia cyriacigeorgica]MBF6454183.1 hypothetical protein [Nocardia cyriacigeorgica]MBF6480641.1 hypothetical protein [Nocardia cyriacigeorgica]MBF6552077.1 hypothetical protein [Nocardia cyriacigeorgica]
MNEHPHTDRATAARLRFLTVRARRAGYQLIPVPDEDQWALLDAADGVELFRADRLDGIEKYLSE